MKKVQRRKKKNIFWPKLLIAMCIFASITVVGYKVMDKKDKSEKTTEEVKNMMASSRTSNQNEKLNYILENESEYTKELVELAERNTEAIQFVYDYPQNKDNKVNISIKDEVGSDKVPLFLQWDERWGYSKYGNSIIGINGCGPTCLSMVATYILKTDYMNPEWMSEFSESEGYVSNDGTLWALMSKGAEKIGLESIEIPLDENRIFNNLEVGNPIICSMRPGDFTTEGHFIVLAGVKDGKIVVNDPNSKKNSEKLWTYDEIEGQIKNLWVFR